MKKVKETIKTGKDRWKSPTPEFWKNAGWVFSFVLGALFYVQTLPGIPGWLQIVIGIFVAGLGRVMAEFGSSDEDLSKK